MRKSYRSQQMLQNEGLLTKDGFDDDDDDDKSLDTAENEPPKVVSLHCLIPRI